MFAALGELLTGLLGGLLARVLIGAGMGVVTYGVLTTAVAGALSAMVAQFGGIPADMLNLLLLSGVGQGLSIIGAAMSARAAMRAASVGVGMAASSSGGSAAP
ncbi:DUF2523 family protein [Metallibacterium sp.]|uniref:DUF2523 family protein n=1 Tax=Metallibacterium sp. TaxID=2940281 RepID=UPI002637CCDC|nr:DUF2523 family protein [Metallibacterium sp.]